MPGGWSCAVKFRYFYTKLLSGISSPDFFAGFDKLRINKEDAIKTIPEMETQSGDSSGRIIQLKIAPETGIRNFHILSSDTFTVGLRSNVFQMVMAAADKKLNQARAIKYSAGKSRVGNPSIGKEMSVRNAPPIKSDADVKTIGEILCFFLATTTFVIPDAKLLSRSKITPVKAISAPEGRLFRPNVITATPRIPNKILPVFIQSIRSPEMEKCATNATNKGDEPTIMAEMEAGTILTPR